MRRLGIKLAKFSTVAWPERLILLVAMAWLPLFWLGLRVLGLQRMQRWLQRGKPPVGSSLSFGEIARIAALVNMAASQAWIPATCLTRSLLLGWMLRRRGVASQLRIGVRINQGILDAHAWVEYAGTPVNDREDVGEQFSPFAEILPVTAFHAP
jgi:hypothetical protein